jgi:hypothetical protein
MKFKPMSKIGRNALTMYVTEKLDGSNSSIHIFLDTPEDVSGFPYAPTAIVGNHHIYTASRKRWIAPAEDTDEKGSDNFGFAKWVKDNAVELVNLGEGSHFGEWVGPGIQKNPHQLEEKTFYLFNNYRWGAACTAKNEGHKNVFPDCAQVVPHLLTHTYGQDAIETAMIELAAHGSHIGGKPEGIMIYLPEADHYQKVTFEFSEGKWKTPV